MKLLVILDTNRVNESTKQPVTKALSSEEEKVVLYVAPQKVP